MDVFDLLRKLRHKEAEAQPWDYHKPMMAFAPVIGAKPSSGVLLGAAGNVAFFRGDPATTRISSLVTSGTFSTKKQTSLTNRFTMFGAENRWRLDGDERFQWTSLGAATPAVDDLTDRPTITLTAPASTAANASGAMNPQVRSMSVPISALINIARIERTFRPLRVPAPPASGESAARPVIVSVRTVVVTSATASLRTIAFRRPIAMR